MRRSCRHTTLSGVKLRSETAAAGLAAVLRRHWLATRRPCLRRSSRTLGVRALTRHQEMAADPSRRRRIRCAPVTAGEKHYAIVDTDTAEQSALSQLSTTFSQPELEMFQKIVWQPIPVRLSRR